MRFACPDHGRQVLVQHNGYNLGARAGFHERDMEGITFTFFVMENSEDNLDLVLYDADGARDYLSKFADWEEKVTEAAENEYEHACPECGNGALMFRLEDDEPVPKV